jgi:hypothetical protein
MRVVILIATLLASGRFAQAQATPQPNTRQGIWIGVGVGGGSAQTNCSYPICGSDRLGGTSGYIGLGGTLSPHVRLGGETNVWVRSNGFGTDVIEFVSLVGQWYPSRTGASYLKVGLGAMRLNSSNGGVADIRSYKADAPSATLGIGYELNVHSRVSLVPWINVFATSSVALDYHLGFINLDPPTSPPHISINFVQAGLGLTWHRSHHGL